MNLGAQKVKAWRFSQSPRVRQAALSTRFGLSPIMWSRIERGERRPPLAQAVSLEAAGVCKAEDWFAPPLSLSDSEFNRHIRENPRFFVELVNGEHVYQKVSGG